MLQYLIILLDDTSVSYCHYKNDKSERKLISLEDLKAGILFGMKENLMIQFVYPSYELPADYQEVIESIDNNKIKPSALCSDADVVVFDNNSMKSGEIYFDNAKSYVFRVDKAFLLAECDYICDTIGQVTRLNIVITDIETFTEEDFENYGVVLHKFADKLEMCYVNGKTPQLNILTDRIMLNKMNNCDAGVSNITLAPDGLFYICPAFYYAGSDCSNAVSQADVCKRGYSVGNLKSGLDIKNQQLYRLDHAPLCRNCDAYQCKRCVWLNRRTTLEVNTPSHEQCVIAHLERNASRELLSNIRKHGTFLPEQNIAEIDYLDPFDNRDSHDY